MILVAQANQMDGCKSTNYLGNFFSVWLVKGETADLNLAESNK
jgi:hypothetical protein